MEHLRVRRAGFAYRRKYEVFLKRYEGPQSFRPYAWFLNETPQFKKLLSSAFKTCWVGCLLHLADINPCARPPGLTGEGCLLMEWKCLFNIWATCQMSTKWDGEDLGSQNTAERTHFKGVTKKQLSFYYSTKIFIRHPRTLFATEDAYEKCKHELGECKSTVINVVSSLAAQWFNMLLWICSDEAPGQIQRIQSKGGIQKTERSW